MYRTFRVPNIDSSRPIVEKKHKALEKCPKCGIRTEFKIKIIANELERVEANLWQNCVTKMRGLKNATECGQKITHSFKTTMPKGK